MPFDSPSDIIFFERNCLLLSTKAKKKPLETHSKCLNFYRCGPISNLHMKCKLNISLILKKGSTNWARSKKPNILSIIQNERKKPHKRYVVLWFVWSVTDQIKFNKLVFAQLVLFLSFAWYFTYIFWLMIFFLLLLFDLFVGHKSHTYIHIVWSCHLDILLSFRLAQEKLW